MCKILRLCIGMLAITFFPALQASESGGGELSKKATILFLGKSGVGKSRMIDMICNYIKHGDQVNKWEDLVPIGKGEDVLGHGDTKECTVYTVKGNVDLGEGRHIDLTLDMIDTPGVDRRENLQRVHNYLHDGKIGVDVICPVMKSSATRDEVNMNKNSLFKIPRDLFDTDVQKRTLFLFSFADGGKPVMANQDGFDFAFEKLNASWFVDADNEVCMEEGTKRIASIINNIVQIKDGFKELLQVQAPYDDTDIQEDGLDQKNINSNDFRRRRGLRDPGYKEQEGEEVDNSDNDTGDDDSLDLDNDGKPDVTKPKKEQNDPDNQKKSSGGYDAIPILLGIGALAVVGVVGWLYYSSTSKKDGKQAEPSKTSDALGSQGL